MLGFGETEIKKGSADRVTPGHRQHSNAADSTPPGSAAWQWPWRVWHWLGFWLAEPRSGYVYWEPEENGAATVQPRSEVETAAGGVTAAKSAAKSPETKPAKTPEPVDPGTRTAHLDQSPDPGRVSKDPEQEARPKPRPPDSPQSSHQPAFRPARDILDQRLSSSMLWTTLKLEFPEWYGARLDDMPESEARKATHRDMTNRHLTKLSALRRSNAEHALAAPDQFKPIAAVYLWEPAAARREVARSLLRRHSTRRVERTCALSHKPSIEPVRNAVRDDPASRLVGANAPIAISKPRQSDYERLTKQLRSFGWKQSDLEIMSSPAKLNRAPPKKVCKLIREWFQAHLALDDTAMQNRLLKESLKPIIQD